MDLYSITRNDTGDAEEWLVRAKNRTEAGLMVYGPAADGWADGAGFHPDGSNATIRRLTHHAGWTEIFD